MQKGKRSGRRKPYHPPRLVRYGDLRRLTAASAKGGTKHDSSLPHTKA